MKLNAKGLLVGLALACSSVVCAAGASDVFFDDFSSGKLDPKKWYAANKNWGGTIKVDGEREDYNGGVVPENLYVKDGVLQCEAHGNFYEGDIRGITKKKSYHEAKLRKNGKRVGACAVTRDYFASGSYEIRAKVAPAPGVCCTMWTFEYEELYDKSNPDFKGSGEYYVVNHEIDIEMPGRPTNAHKDISYNYALCNTWIGEKGSEYTASHTKLPQPQDDGKFHTYRFDWHTGDKAGTIKPRVEFYFDNVCVMTNYTHVPTKAGRLWVGSWFPNGWAGVPDFDTSVFEVDYVKITPFHEENDQPQKESFGTDGLVAPFNINPHDKWEVGSGDAKAVTARLNSCGELVFSGKGTVKDFASAAEIPWKKYVDRITAVVYTDDIKLGKRSLVGLDSLAYINGLPVDYVNGKKSEMFYDDFTGSRLDATKWFAANKNWGGKVKVNGVTEDYNGGVVPKNLYVKDGILQCEAHGNLYEGKVRGICKQRGDSPAKERKNGKRVGACAVTRDYFASGSYEIRAKVAPVPGVCCTMWTFEYEELYDKKDPDFLAPGGEYYVVNHEIDIEMPGRPTNAHKNIGYDYALCNTWIGEKNNEYIASHTKLPKRQDDGEFHTYRFDWHTGNKAGTIRPRVDFYFDGVRVMTNLTHIPNKAGRLWVGSWFPNGWAGVPDFDTSVFEVDWVKIIPYHEENDRPQKETYGSAGLAEPVQAKASTSNPKK